MKRNQGRRPSCHGRASYQNADVVVPKCVYVRYPLMSPNTDIDIAWDPSSLRLDRDVVARSESVSRPGRRAPPIPGKFIAGPINVPWVCKAGQLGVKALLVGLVLWHIKGLRKTDTFTV